MNEYNYQLCEQLQRSILTESSYPDGRKAFGISFNQFAALFKKEYDVDLIAIAREFVEAEKAGEEPAMLAASFQPKIGKYVRLINETISKIEEISDPREGANIHYLSNFHLKVILEGCYRVENEGKEVSQHGVMGKGAKRSSKVVHSTTRKKTTPDEYSKGDDIITLIDGSEIDTSKLKQQFLELPKKFIATNSKLAATKVKQTDTGIQQQSKFFDITLPAYAGLYYDLKKNKFGIVSTCPGAGECVIWCYASKGGYLMFEGPALNGARFLTQLINFPEKVETEIIKTITNKRTKQKIYLRWHDAGDFFSKGYLQFAIDIAKKTPNVIHYAYTKNFKLVRSMSNELPANFVFNFSTGSNVEGTPEDLQAATEKTATMLPYAYFDKLNLTVPETYGLIKQQNVKHLVENKKRLGWKAMISVLTDWVYKNDFAHESIKSPEEFKQILESMVEASGVKYLPFNGKRKANTLLTKMILYKDGIDIAKMDTILDNEDEEEISDSKISGTIKDIPIKKQLFNEKAFNKPNFKKNLSGRRKLAFIFDGEDLDTLKTNAQKFIKQKFDLDIDKSLIKSYDEAEEEGILSDTSKSLKYVVLVWGGHGDAEATTMNVRMTLLLQH